jgi:hypothetical protein
MKKLLFFIAFPAALLLGVSIWKILQNRIIPTPGKIEAIKTIEDVPKLEISTSHISEKEFSFENVSFVYDTSLFSDVKGETVSASLLEDPTHKPSNVYPNHINFVFKKPYTGEQTSGEELYSDSLIDVYPIEEYKKAYSFYGINLEREFGDLKEITAKSSKFSPGSGKKQMLYIPFVDEHQAFYSNVKVLQFQNGKGLLYLTQWQPDEHVINNTRLQYIFQGITNDNKYFVFMTFPVSVKGFPKDDDARYQDKYERLNDTSEYWSKNYQNLYAKYALETAVKLDKMPPEDFTPNLNKIESLIRSLKIK